MSNAAHISDSYPLSPMQQGMLYHALAEPRSGVDVEQLVITLREAVDIPRLRKAWERVVARHAVLRTAFQVTDQGPRQLVYASVTVPWEEEDWSAQDQGSRRARLSAWLQKDRERGFEMDCAPLLRFRLIQHGPEDFQLVWTFHHALLDGRSFPPLLEEAFRFYADPAAPEPLPPRPFRDFIDWLQVQDHAASESYWRAKLAGFSAPTPLPVQGLPGCTKMRQQGDEEIRLSAELTRRVKETAEQCGATVNTMVQAAWAILLSRYSGEGDVCFGATRAGRHGTVNDAGTIIGVFINTIPVRAQISATGTVRDLLQQLRRDWVEARPHEHTPLARIQSWSAVPGGQSLFQTLVVFENYDLAESFAKADGWERRQIRLHEQTSFPICLAAYSGAELRLVAEYDRSRLDPETIHRLLGHLQVILTGLTNAEATIGSLDILAPGECESLLAMWEHSPGADARSEKTLHGWFEEQVARTPDAIALVQDAVRLTYAEVNERAEIVATHLAAAGARPETIVGLCLERTPLLVIGLLGILKANAAYLPIDLAYPADRLAFMLEDAKAPLLLTQQHLAGQLPALPGTKVLRIDDMTEPVARAPRPAGSPGQLCYVIYTSGSTGKPKGCCISHHNVTRLFTSTEHWFGFDSRDVWTLFHSTAFDFSVWELWGALLYGGTLVVVPFATSRSPDLFRQLLSRERVTVLNQTPSAFRQLIAADAEQSSALHLRYVIFGGEALEMQSLEPWFAKHGDRAPQLVNMYGITETTVHVTYRPLRASDTQSGSVIGEPIPDLRLHILDAAMRPVPLGVPGELYVGGSGVARGYLDRPDLTAARFLPSPFHEGERLYRTGDLARVLPGGDIEYLGRIDQQVKIRGFRIEVGEIESVLRRHPAIREAAVLARPDAAGGKRLVAWLVCEGMVPCPAELRMHLKAFLPEYMVPAAYVPVDRIPLTNNGKLDAQALPEPAEHRPDLAARYVPPASEAEKTLAGIWSHVLKVEQIGVQDNFFELGGDSILSILVVTQARRAGIEFTPKHLFDHPTIRGLASLAAPQQPRMAETGAEGDVPLTPIQQWFFAHDFADAHHWNQSFTFTLRNEVARGMMARALDQVLAAHPVFRLRFEQSGDGWRQSFGPPLAPIAALEPTAHDLQSSLRLDGPLARFAFDGQRLTAAIHHLIVDGVSWRVFLQDLDAALSGNPLQSPTTSFHTWSRMTHAIAGSPKLRDELPFWNELLAQDSPPLPVDREGAPNTEVTAETITAALSREETSALQPALAAQNASIHDGLLSALARALTGWISADGITVEVEGHGREESILAELTNLPGLADISHTIGWFTTIYPARLERDATPAQIAAAMAKVPRRGFGYALLRASGLLAAKRADVLFNYLGHFDQLAADLQHLQLDQFSTSGWHAPRADRTHLLEINAVILDGCLQARWTFSRAVHDRATVERVAQQFTDALRAMASAGKFALSPVSREELQARVPGADDAYRLSPMQRLFFTLECAKPGSGNDQWHCRIRGSLEIDQFKRAWNQVLERHPALRSAYFGHPEPMAVVAREALPSWTLVDLSNVPSDEQERRFAEYLALDAARAFDLATPPLTRLALFTFGADDHRFVWTHHHLEVDGWSWPIIFREVAELYENRQLPAATPYREYIAWLGRRPSAENFWREQLKGFRIATPLPIEGNPESDACEVVVPIRAPLAEFAQNARITVNAVCQAAWAVFLAQRSTLLDVAFGAAVSGRPADLEGSATMVGHFVNNVPIRAQIDFDQPFAEFCGKIHRQVADVTEHQFAPLADIQSWSELPWNARLFSTLLVFQNYLSAEAPLRFGEASVESLQAPVRANYPITAVFQPGEQFTLRIISLRNVANRAALEDLANSLATLLDNACRSTSATIGELARSLPAREAVAPAKLQETFSVEQFANPNERLIAEIWHGALNRPVSATDNFFDLGGHSLLMLQVHRKLCANLQRQIPVVTLFQHPTIRSLAAHLAGSPSTSPTVSAAQERAAKARAVLARQAPKGRGK